jgi:lantibiotic transport system ATP-binding protein
MMAELAIEAKRLVRRFGKHLAVDDVSLIVPRGVVYGFLGPNGAGKTTTIRMILGLIHPDSGEVSLFGIDVEDRRREALRPVGALVEAPALYNHLTGLENLEIASRLIGVKRDVAWRTLELVGLDRDGGRLVANYSLGMRQRLGIALALLGSPALLILDEPFEGLDPAGIHALRELLANLARGRGVTVFVATRLLSEVERLASHVGIMRRGKLLFDGPIEALKDQYDSVLGVRVADANQAIEILKRAGDAPFLGADGRVLVSISDPADAARINARLVSEGVSVLGLSVDQPSLEEIYLAMTDAVLDRSRRWDE